MAKEGIDSFLLDCHTNDTLAELEAEFGEKGLVIIIKLWQKIYSEKGYYCKWGEKGAVLFLSRWFGGGSGVSKGLINEVVSYAVNIGLFDKTLFEKYNILTSPRIQRQYFDVVKRRECVNVVGDYILLEKNALPKNVSIFVENADINTKNADENATSKVKVSEVKPSEVKKSAAVVCPAGEKTAAAADDLFEYYEKNIGGMSPEIMSNITSYRRIFSDELIIFAIKQAVEANVKNWRYIHAILQRYKKDGVDSPQKAEIRKKVESEPFPVRQNSFNGYGQRDYEEEEYERIIAAKNRKRQAEKQVTMFMEGD